MMANVPWCHDCHKPDALCECETHRTLAAAPHPHQASGFAESISPLTGERRLHAISVQPDGTVLMDQVGVPASPSKQASASADHRGRVMGDKHTVHLANGRGKVVIDGDRVEVHLAGPIVVHRKHWIRYFLPEEEVRRTILASNPMADIEKALVEAFEAVPITVYPESEPQP